FMENLAKNNYTAKSVSRKTNAVKTFFRFLKTEGLVSNDPAVDLAHPHYENTPPRVLSQQEYRALRDACRDDPRTAAMVEILLQTGIKISELVVIETEDVKNGELRVGTTVKNRVLPVNKALKTAIKRYFSVRPKVTSDFLFVTKTGRPLLIRNVRTVIDRYFKASGVQKATVNDLRNTFIAYQLASGVSLETVNRLAGHKRTTSTERYLGLLNNQPAPKTQPEEL
ncbi:MAG: tyrosine-type recombinase/integrase, partial [bacterium]|nr:tyrosine-type recombinase/integrase [bacterium]